jgi:glycosyltransferase involved in cell wall biosynthesis
MKLAINLLTENPRAPSGAQHFWQNLIAAIIPHLDVGEEVLLVVSRESQKVYQHLLEPRVRAVCMPASNENRLFRILTEHFWLPFLLKRMGVTVYSSGVAPLIPLRSMGLVCHIKTMHAYSTPKQIPLLTRVFRKAMYPRTLDDSDAVILNSESIRVEVNQHLRPQADKLHLIYEAVDHDLFRVPHCEAQLESDREYLAEFGISERYVLFLSSLWPYKNAEGLIRAFHLMRNELASVQLVIVGEAKSKEYITYLRELCDELKLSDRVVFCGGVDHDQVPIFYRRAEIFVYPSFNETFGLTILEAMACGCPVVTSDISAMPEIAGGAAVLANPHKVESIARAMSIALEDETRSRLVNAGRKRAAEFTWDKCATETLNVYRKVHAERSEIK